MISLYSNFIIILLLILKIISGLEKAHEIMNASKKYFRNFFPVILENIFEE